MNIVDFTANLARGMPTDMSEMWEISTPANAVDGSYAYNRNQIFECAHAVHDRVGSWWQVDLEAVYDVREVMILGRGDCCGE